MILLGKRIKELRNKYKYTQAELANQVGVTKSTIAAYENDSRQPSYDVLVKLVDVFRVSMDSLFFDRDSNMIDTRGLTAEQVDLMNTMIVHFRKCNSKESLYSDLSPELREKVKEYLDAKYRRKK